jgi:cell wall-associated NlpC family hydrolase
MLESSTETEILGVALPSSSSEREVASDRKTKVVSTTRSWIGTPYHHQMAVKGAGCDCLGLVRGVYAEIYGKPSEVPPPYSRDWAEATGQETLLDAAGRHLICVLPLAATSHALPASGLLERVPALKNTKVTPGKWDIQPGDVLIFRMRRGALAKHAAIATSATTMIHAFEDNSVCEVPLTPWWLRKIAGVYRFPDL